MACAYNKILVSGAGSTGVNGVYTKTNGTLYNASLTMPNFYVKSSGGSLYYLMGPTPFQGNTYSINLSGDGAALYYSNNTGVADVCPDNAALGGFGTSFSASGVLPAPTVAEYVPGPDCSIPANRCAFATGTESGCSRFRRLVALGYV